jgi:glucokinase
MSQPQDHNGISVGIEAAALNLTAIALDGKRNVAGTYARPVEAGAPTTDQLVDFINSLAQEFGKFDRIGIAMPGLVQKATKRVTYSAHVPEHTDVDLAGKLFEATGLSPVIENDANAAAYGEYKLGAGRGSENMFYATLGRGVGGAFIFGGKIWHGASGYAGEFGFIAINSDGMRLEEVASAENIVRRTRSRFNRDSTSSLNRLDEQSIYINDILKAAENGDDFAQLMLERTGNYVGTAVASVINLLNIERIVLGGAIMHAGNLVLDAVIRRARELSFEPSFQNTEIVAGSLGTDAAPIGAALLAAEVS